MVQDLFTTRTYRKYWKTVFWILLFSLLFLTLTPTPPNPIKFTHIDKIYHFIGFSAFSFVFRFSFIKKSTLFILFYSILLGVAVEVAQLFVPNRGFSLMDMIADGIGSVVGVFAAHAIIRLRTGVKTVAEANPDQE